MARKDGKKAVKPPLPPFEAFEGTEDAPEEAPLAVLTLKKDISEEDIEEIRAKMDAERPIIVVPEAPEAPETAPEPPEKAFGPIDGDLRAGISRILCVKKGKRDVPTEVMYHSAYARADRYVIIDVNVNLLEDAWRYYCANSPDKDPEVFLAIVYDICKLDIPRMYRAVGKLKLE